MALFSSYLFPPAQHTSYLGVRWAVAKDVNEPAEGVCGKGSHHVQGCMSRVASRLRKAFPPFCHHLWNLLWSVWLFERHQDTGASLAKGHQGVWGPENMTSEEKLRERRLFSLEKRSLRAGVFNALLNRRVQKKVQPASSRRGYDKRQQKQIAVWKIPTGGGGEMGISPWAWLNTGTDARRGGGISVFSNTQFKWTQPSATWCS